MCCQSAKLLFFLIPLFLAAPRQFTACLPVFSVGGADQGSAVAPRGTGESRQNHCSAHVAVSTAAAAATTTTTSAGTNGEVV